MGFVAETGSGHFLTMDGAPDGGGRNLAPRPMETVLAGTGGCTAYDVVLILKRGRHDVRGCQVKMRPSAPKKDPKVFTRIHMHFVVTGSAACRRRRWSAPSRCRTNATARPASCWARRPRSPPASKWSRPDREVPAPRRAESDSVCRGRHHLGRAAHRPAHGQRQGRAPACGGLGMAAFVVLHLGHDGTRAAVGRRQASRWPARWASTWRSVSTTKPRLTRVAQPPGQQADAEGAGVPERVEQAGTVAQFVQALLRPGQVVDLLARGAPSVGATPACAPSAPAPGTAPGRRPRRRG
jgi:uncharacterized OsmC-like protein